MNRVQGDYIETLLYKIFVSIDENTSIGELSSILQIDVNTAMVRRVCCARVFVMVAARAVVCKEDGATKRPSFIACPQPKILSLRTPFRCTAV